jgi:type VI secretion system protein ImpH
MAGENRDQRNHLILRLQSEPYKFDFFHVLRLIECAYPEKPLIGQSKRLTDDPVRFAQEVTLAFEPSTISRYIPAKEGRAPRLNEYFFGLFGPNGPMPLHITEYVKSRIHNHHDETMSRFADIFHHRMISFFYRAKVNTEPTYNFDRPFNDKFSSYTGSLLGIGHSSMLKRDAMPDLAKLHYAGFLSHHAKNADGLKAIIADFFKLPVNLREFIGEWQEIQTSDLTRLGRSRETSTLGRTAVIGSRVWSCQNKFRLIFGPLTLEQYESLLPMGKRLEKLIAIVRNYVGYELQWDVNLVLKSEEIKGVRLGDSSRLGWTSWLGLRTSLKDADQLILNPNVTI